VSTAAATWYRVWCPAVGANGQMGLVVHQRDDLRDVQAARTVTMACTWANPGDGPLPTSAPSAPVATPTAGVSPLGVRSCGRPPVVSGGIRIVCARRCTTTTPTPPRKHGALVRPRIEAAPSTL